MEIPSLSDTTEAAYANPGGADESTPQTSAYQWLEQEMGEASVQRDTWPDLEELSTSSYNRFGGLASPYDDPRLRF